MRIQATDAKKGMNIKMKNVKILFLLLMIIICLCLVSCDTAKEPARHFQTSWSGDIWSFGLVYDELITCQSGKFFFASDGNSIGYYNLENGEHTALAKLPVSAMYAREDELFVISSGSLTVIDMVGEIVSETPLGIEFSENGKMKIYTDGKIAVITEIANTASRQTNRIFFVDLQSGKVTECDVKSDSTLTDVYSIGKKDGRIFVLTCRYSDKSGRLKNGVFELDGKNGKLDLISALDGDCGFFFSEKDGMIYYITDRDGVLGFCQSDTDGNVRTLRSIFKDKYLEATGEYSPRKINLFICGELFFSDGYFIISDPVNHTVSVVCTHDEDGKTLYVIYPTDVPFDSSAEVHEETAFDNISRDFVSFEEREDCKVYGITYPINEYVRRLSMKMLAGEDDFDVVYADRFDEGSILSATLRYKLYEPLQNYDAIKEKIGNLVPEAVEYMTVDGDFIGVPYQIDGHALAVNPKFNDTSLILPDGEWTLDNFFALCEEAIPYCDKTTALIFSPEEWIIEEIIESGLQSGSFDESLFRSAVEQIVRYKSLGVFSTYSQVDTILLEDVTIPARENIITVREGNTVIPRPKVNGEKHAALSAFVFVSSQSKNKELGAKYAAMHMDEDFICRQEREKSYLSTADEYYTLEWDDGMFHGSMNSGEWINENADIGEYRKMLIEKYPDVFSGTTIYTVDCREIAQKVREVFAAIETGELTTDGAANELYTYTKRRYIE